MFHGRISYKALDLKMGIRLHKKPMPTLQIAQDMLEQKKLTYQDVWKKAMQAYIKYRAYNDKNQVHPN